MMSEGLGRIVTPGITGLVMLLCMPVMAQDLSPSPAVIDTAPNPLEKIYRDRIGSDIHRLGSSELGRGNTGDTPAIGNAWNDVSDNQILSIGDRISVWLRGGINREEEQAITSDGTLILRDLPPIAAQGQSLGSLRNRIRDIVKQQHPDTDAFVTLAGLRPITVLVSGAVQQPGPVQIPANSDVMAALRAAGGITPLGSHRALMLGRDNAPKQMIDLYPVIRGGAQPQPMRNGDRLEIPPVGQTVAVTGAVREPAIIELAPHQTLSVADAIDLAGGALIPRGSRVILGRLDARGQEQQTNSNPADDMSVMDGDIITVTAQTAPESGGVRLHLPGQGVLSMTLDAAPTLGRLMDDPAIISQKLYPLCGVIRRQPGDAMAGEMIAFAPAEVKAGQYDRRLEDRDEVILFDPHAFPAAQNVSAINADDQDVTAFLAEHDVAVTGSVRRPGHYPLCGHVAAQDVVAVSGGMTQDARPDGLEILHRIGQDTQPHSSGITLIQAGDALHIPGNPRGPARALVHLAGAVRFPGDYPIQPGEKLSSLLKRAGGLTEQAYAPGAVFTRISERKNEQARYVEAARQLDAALSRQLSAEDKPNRDVVDTTRALSRELRQSPALGRITVEADPGILASRPELDMLLEDGDSITYPQRAAIIRVAGEVQSPTTLQFQSGKKPGDYLNEAGGLTAMADADRAFVLLPDGRAQPLENSTWRRDGHVILPGSTIIVPRDAKPLDTLQMTTAVGNIIGQIAITAASIASIHNNDH